LILWIQEILVTVATEEMVVTAAMEEMEETEETAAMEEMVATGRITAQEIRICRNCRLQVAGLPSSSYPC